MFNSFFPPVVVDQPTDRMLYRTCCWDAPTFPPLTSASILSEDINFTVSSHIWQQFQTSRLFCGKFHESVWLSLSQKKNITWWMSYIEKWTLKEIWSYSMLLAASLSLKGLQLTLWQTACSQAFKCSVTSMKPLTENCETPLFSALILISLSVDV